MASATPSCFCTTQKHLAVKRSRSSIRRFLGACCEVTLQREECEKPWCLTDNALPCDTPQLAAGRLHCAGRVPVVSTWCRSRERRRRGVVWGTRLCFVIIIGHLRRHSLPTERWNPGEFPYGTHHF